MARQFNGTSDYMQSRIPLPLSDAGTGPISISFDLSWDVFSADDDIVLETSPDWNSNAGTFLIDPNNGGGGILFGHGATGGAYRYGTISQPSAAAFHHYFFVIPTLAASGLLAWVDDVSQTVSIGADTGGTAWGNWTLNIMARNASSLFGAGRLANLGIWIGDQSAFRTRLKNGEPPKNIAPASLKLFLQFRDTIAGVEYDKSGMVVNHNVVGTTIVADPAEVVDSVMQRTRSMRPRQTAPGLAR